MEQRIRAFFSFVIVLVTINSCKNGTTSESNKNTATESKIDKVTNLKPAVPIGVDGNVYDTVRIRTQVWMKENLKTTHYRDGSPITEIEDSKAWVSIHETRSHTPAWCYYNGDTANNYKYRKLYNWYAVTDPRNICPIGWHVPSELEWAQLVKELGGEGVAGGKMKAKKLWRAPNTHATNSSGFTALPAEIRYLHGGYSDSESPCYCCTFWSSTKIAESENFAHSYSLGSASSYLDYSSIGEDMSCGFSVRCVRDSK